MALTSHDRLVALHALTQSLGVLTVDVARGTLTQPHRSEPTVSVPVRRYVLLTISRQDHFDEYWTTFFDTIEALEASATDQLRDEYPWTPYFMADLDTRVVFDARVTLHPRCIPD